MQTVILAEKDGGRQFGDFQDQQSAFNIQYQEIGPDIRVDDTNKENLKTQRTQRKAAEHAEKSL
jgi:hypothetical protein